MKIRVYTYIKSDYMTCRITRADAKTIIASMGVQYLDELYKKLSIYAFGNYHNVMCRVTRLDAKNNISSMGMQYADE